MSEPTVEDRIRELADREAIRDLVHHYADCVWSMDAEGAAALFTEDGEMDTGQGPVLQGSAAIAEAYGRSFGSLGLQPFVHNHRVELHGDEATGTCHLDLRATMGGESMIGSGRYEDRYVRVGGGWRFRSRRLVMSWLVPLDRGWAGGGRD